jgi:23S rRNA (cytidine1920-2'-O)/16S rRNA (cytidine1409-2'-O)-methyltransferase
VVREHCNVRDLGPDDCGGAFDVVVADLSFISLTTVAAALVRCTRERGELVVLVKPQFEAGRREVSAGRGVITDPASWRGALERVASSLASHGTAVRGVVRSPLTGGDGNVEFLLHAGRGGPGLSTAQLDAVLDDVTGVADPSTEPGAPGPHGGC